MTSPADLQAADSAAADASDGSVVAALAQLAPRLGDVGSNLAKHLEVLAEARRGGAHLVVFPELSLTGYFLKDLVPDVAMRADAPELMTIAASCTEVDAVVGTVLESDDARFHNASLYFSQGRLQHVHRKVYLPTYGLFDEQRYFAAGDRIGTFSAPLAAARQRRPWEAGILTCEDIWHPSAPALLSREGMELLIVPSASPGRGITHAETLGTAGSYDHMTKTYAQLLTTYLLYCNRVGYEDGVGFWGGSRAVGPDGRLLGEPAGAGEELVWHRLDLGAVRRARIATPLLRDERHDITDFENQRLRSRPHR
jgi:predicted amidohydrolase